MAESYTATDCKMIKTNYHTHTVFCDGKNSLEEMITAAAAAKFSVFGFSAHTLYPFSTNWHIHPDNCIKYISQIKSHQEKYKDTLELLAGFEVDYFPPISLPDSAHFNQMGADYIIGSTHYISTAQIDTPVSEQNSNTPHEFTVDGPIAEVLYGLNTLFHGDGKKLVQVYYQTVRDMITHCSFDILGHIDLVRRRNNVIHFFDETEQWYKREIAATAETVAKSGCIVEVNTGGMARGCTKTPYPSPDFLNMLNRKNVPVVIDSDAHTIQTIDFAFDIAVQTLKEAGYHECQYLSQGRWHSQSL